MSRFSKGTPNTTIYNIKSMIRLLIKGRKRKLFLLSNRTKNTIFITMKLDYIWKSIMQSIELIIGCMPKSKMPKIWLRKNRNVGNRMNKRTKNWLQNWRSYWNGFAICWTLQQINIVVQFTHSNHVPTWKVWYETKFEKKNKATW